MSDTPASASAKILSMPHHAWLIFFFLIPHTSHWDLYPFSNNSPHEYKCHDHLPTLWPDRIPPVRLPSASVFLFLRLSSLCIWVHDCGQGQSFGWFLDANNFLVRKAQSKTCCSRHFNSASTSWQFITSRSLDEEHQKTQFLSFTPLPQHHTYPLVSRKKCHNYNLTKTACISSWWHKN